MRAAAALLREAVVDGDDLALTADEVRTALREECRRNGAPATVEEALAIDREARRRARDRLPQAASGPA